MNMVRAGVVAHPSEWEFCGYNEIQEPKPQGTQFELEQDDFSIVMDLLENRIMLPRRSISQA